MLNPIKNMKFHTKLLLSYILACIIPLLIASYTIYDFSVKNLEDSSMEFASIFNSQIVTNIENFIDRYDKTTKSMLVDNDVITRINNEENATMSDLIGNRMVVEKLMMRLETLNPDTKAIMLLNTKNKMYQNNDTINIVELQQQEWFKEILQNKDVMFITAIHDKSYYNNLKDGAVITIGRVILNSYGEYSGILLIDIDPSSLVELNDNFLIARNNYNIKITVTDHNNGIIYDSDAASGRISWNDVVNNENTDLSNKNSNNYLLMQDKTYRGNLTVTAVIPRSSLLFKIGRVKYITLLAVLVCIIIIIATSVLFSYTITRPIKNLNKRMRQAENGQYLTTIQNNFNDEIGSLMTSYNNMILKIKSLIEDVYIAQIKHKNAKLLALQMQINPHMLYNTLDSIRMKALVKGDDEIALMIKILARMFKLTLQGGHKHNLIDNELEYAQNYIKLQNIRFNDIFSLEIQMDENIKSSHIIVMVLQPIIENCIVHGFQDYNTRLNIVIKGEIIDENDIIILISDDGIGMPWKKAEEINKLLIEAETNKLKLDSMDEVSEDGIGLRNIAERIKLRYGDKYYLKLVTGSNPGTVVEIKIPKT